MRWRAWATVLGATILGVGGIVMLAGLGITVLGPQAIDGDDAAPSAAEKLAPLSTQDGHGTQGVADRRADVRSMGGFVLSGGALAMILGGVLVASARSAPAAPAVAPAPRTP